MSKGGLSQQWFFSTVHSQGAFDTVLVNVTEYYCIIVLSQNFPKNMFNDKKQHKTTKKISDKPYLKKISLT